MNLPQNGDFAGWREMRRWMINAKAGKSAIYHRGNLAVAAMRSKDVARFSANVRKQYEAGWITLAQRRAKVVGDDGVTRIETHYLAIRTRNIHPDAEAAEAA